MSSYMFGKAVHDAMAQACGDLAQEANPMPKSEMRLQVEERQAAQQNARSVQVGGDHYTKLAIQPFDYITANGIGFAEGSAIKYLTRWRAKGGVQDLRKARHFIDMLIERETGQC